MKSFIQGWMNVQKALRQHHDEQQQPALEQPASKKPRLRRAQSGRFSAIVAQNSNCIQRMKSASIQKFSTSIDSSYISLCTSIQKFSTSIDSSWNSSGSLSWSKIKNLGSRKTSRHQDPLAQKSSQRHHPGIHRARNRNSSTAIPIIQQPSRFWDPAASTIAANRKRPEIQHSGRIQKTFHNNNNINTNIKSKPDHWSTTTASSINNKK